MKLCITDSSKCKHPTVPTAMLRVRFHMGFELSCASIRRGEGWVYTSSSSIFFKFLETVLRTPTTLGITVTFVFHNFFSSLARSRDVSIISLSFILLNGRSERQNPLVLSSCKLRWPIYILKIENSLWVCMCVTRHAVKYLICKN